MRIALGLFIAMSLFSFEALSLESKCYPATPAAKNWPVCVIYLHGLHPTNETGSYNQYEAKNRPELAQFSDDYLERRHCRMAAPVAPDRASYIKQSDGTVRYWNTFKNWQSQSLENVEAAARNACGGKDVKLMKGRALIGFSAGGWEALHLAATDKNGGCPALSEYSEVWGHGLPELSSKLVRSDDTVKGTCSKFHIVQTHAFQRTFSDSFQRQFAAVLPYNPDGQSYPNYAAAAAEPAPRYTGAAPPMIPSTVPRQQTAVVFPPPPPPAAPTAPAWPVHFASVPYSTVAQ